MSFEPGNDEATKAGTGDVGPQPTESPEKVTNVQANPTEPTPSVRPKGRASLAPMLPEDHPFWRIGYVIGERKPMNDASDNSPKTDPAPKPRGC